MSEDRLRPVAALTFPDIEPGTVTTAVPEVTEVDPTDLVVDEQYQRNLSERSRRLIRRLVAAWDWRAYKPPNVVRVGGALHVIDGQHTAIAAASHPGVGRIPVLIVDAPEASDRATAFVRLNRDRISVTPPQLFHALVEAGDEDALTMAQVCARAGVTILKAPPGAGHYRVGETVSVSTIRTLINRRFAIGARRVLEILVKAKQAPVGAAGIRAVEALLFDPEFSGGDPEDIVTALREMGPSIERDARRIAADQGVRQWRGLATAIHRAVTGRARRGR